jgi:pimeloyl-ACP methyl ester carboxylesterase
MVVAAGCWTPPTPTAGELERGLVYMFPGIEGSDWSLQEAYAGLRDAGLDRAVRVYKWPDGSNGYLNLTALERNRREARDVVAELANYRRTHATQPIDLVGYSGGGGMAVLVAEAVPNDLRLRDVVLVHAAVSPRYDLSRVMDRIDGRLVSLCADTDWLILGAGTSVFGTIDRYHGSAAGRVGFEIEQALPDPADRKRFVEFRWNLEEAELGEFGQHGQILMRGWNRTRVAPWLVNDTEVQAPIKPAATRYIRSARLGPPAIRDTEASGDANPLGRESTNSGLNQPARA